MIRVRYTKMKNLPPIERTFVVCESCDKEHEDESRAVCIPTPAGWKTYIDGRMRKHLCPECANSPRGGHFNAIISPTAPTTTS